MSNDHQRDAMQLEESSSSALLMSPEINDQMLSLQATLKYHDVGIPTTLAGLLAQHENILELVDKS